MQASDVAIPVAELPFDLRGGDDALPLHILARAEAGGAALEPLCSWLRAHPAWVGQKLRHHGALRFRGFEVEKPEHFEALARAVDPELKNEYLGTSPRDALTDYVFNASELPDFYPIPQHCEMSFCARPPRAVFFCCLVEPAADCGETPLCDFRAVWRALPEALRERFENRGLRHIRNYGPPGTTGDAVQLKPWDEMFLTEDRSEVEAQCAEEGFEAIWLPDGGLRLVSTQPVARVHPETGEPVWHNHLTTFHRSTAEAEYRRIAAYRPTERNRNLLKIAEKLDSELRAKASEEQSMHTTHLDGGEIAEEDVEAVRDAVWQHLVVEAWKQGDVVAIDNHSVSHGRLPYEGDRHVVVCWA